MPNGTTTAVQLLDRHTDILNNGTLFLRTHMACCIYETALSRLRLYYSSNVTGKNKKCVIGVVAARIRYVNPWY